MEKPNARGSNNFIVGLFVFVTFLVVAGFVVFMGGSSPFSGEAHVRSFFRDIRGLNVGAPVYFSGIQVGRVSGYEFPTPEEAAKPGQETGVFVVMSVFREHKDRVRRDSMVTISTQGVLGDKVVVIKPGTDAAGVIGKNLVTLPSSQPQDLADYFKKGGDLVENLGQALTTLNSILNEVHDSGHVANILANFDKASASLVASSHTMENLSKEDLTATMKSLRRILEKVDKGEGTLGALINDPSLHEDLRALVGGAKRSTAVRFLIRQAISAGDNKTPPPPAPAK